MFLTTLAVKSLQMTESMSAAPEKIRELASSLTADATKETITSVQQQFLTFADELEKYRAPYLNKEEVQHLQHGADEDEAKEREQALLDQIAALQEQVSQLQAKVKEKVPLKRLSKDISQQLENLPKDIIDQTLDEIEENEEKEQMEKFALVRQLSAQVEKEQEAKAKAEAEELEKIDKRNTSAHLSPSLFTHSPTLCVI